MPLKLIEQLKSVRHFKRRSVDFLKATQLTGKGKLSFVEYPRGVCLIEKGLWENGNTFSNRLLWEVEGSTIYLSALKPYGLQALFSFPLSSKSLATNPYLCGQDRYSASIDFNDKQSLFSCQVKGPRKHQDLSLIYYFQ